LDTLIWLRSLLGYTGFYDVSRGGLSKTYMEDYTV